MLAPAGAIAPSTSINRDDDAEQRVLLRCQQQDRQGLLDRLHTIDTQIAALEKQKASAEAAVAEAQAGHDAYSVRLQEWFLAGQEGAKPTPPRPVSPEVSATLTAISGALAVQHEAAASIGRQLQDAESRLRATIRKLIAVRVARLHEVRNHHLAAATAAWSAIAGAASVLKEQADKPENDGALRTAILQDLGALSTPAHETDHLSVQQVQIAHQAFAAFADTIGNDADAPAPYGEIIHD